MHDIISIAFVVLRSCFFDKAGDPIPFSLRDKLNTQDDPFDEFLASDVLANPQVNPRRKIDPAELLAPDADNFPLPHIAATCLLGHLLPSLSWARFPLHRVKRRIQYLQEGMRAPHERLRICPHRCRHRTSENALSFS